MALFPRFTGVFWKLCKLWTWRWMRFITGEPLVVYGIFWTTFLAAVVTVACAACQLAFTSAVLSRRGIGNTVKSEVFVRVPLDMPGDVITLPVALFKPSVMDFVIPPMFAAVVVTASACFVYAVEIWEIL